MPKSLSKQLFSSLQLRAEPESIVRRDLLGPASGPQEEVDDFAVSGRYVLSLLVVRVLGHAFHQTAQSVRLTISEAARREVLGRLLDLNHQHHAEEEAARFHGKKRKGGGSQWVGGGSLVESRRSQGTGGKAKREKRQGPLYPFTMVTFHDR